MLTYLRYFDILGPASDAELLQSVLSFGAVSARGAFTLLAQPLRVDDEGELGNCRILIGECKQETSSFNPRPTGYEDFIAQFGDGILRYHRRVESEIRGALQVFDGRAQIELVPTFSVRAITSGGAVDSASFNRLLGEMMDSVRSAARPDGVYLSLHGAMVAENEDDTEGRILEEIREIIGEDIPIVVSLDLHGILTDRMLELSDAVVVYQTYPHIDFVQTGERSARLLLKIMDRSVRPFTARVRIPALVRGDELITETGLFGRSIRYAKSVQASPPGLSAAMFIGNPFTDVPDLASYSVVVTDNDPLKAEAEAIRMAEDFWALRYQLHSQLTSLPESIAIAAGPNGRIVLADAADATSSGASGDSNAILRGLIEAGCKRTILVPIVDEPAVKVAFAAGPGKQVKITVGGSIDSRFQPLPLNATVVSLSDGECKSESDGSTWHAGRTAVLESDSVTIVVTSRPIHLYDRSLFLAQELDPAEYEIVVVKSPHCQPQFFARYADRIINVDAPGATSANLQTLGHRRCARPIFPLDEHAQFVPHAKLFQRKTA